MIQTKKLLKRFSNITTHVVEPNEEAIKKYQDAVHHQICQSDNDMPGVRYEWYNQTLQDFMRRHIRQKYHFISLVHSVYFIWDVDLEGAIKELYKLLEPGGIMFIVLWRGI